MVHAMSSEHLYSARFAIANALTRAFRSGLANEGLSAAHANYIGCIVADEILLPIVAELRGIQGYIATDRDGLDTTSPMSEVRMKIAALIDQMIPSRD